MSENTAIPPERAVAIYRGEASKLHPLAKFGENKVVRALAGRIMLSDYRDTKLTDDEAIVVAQASVVEGLSPFPPNPELWAWVQEWYDNQLQRKVRRLTIMRGRDGTLKVAMDNMRREGTHMLPPRFTVIPETDVDRRKKLNIPDGAMAVWCEVQDHRSVTEWQARYNKMADAGASDDTIIKRIGEVPTYTGLGILKATEIKKLDGGKNNMTHLERTQKRSLTAALRMNWGAPRFQDPVELERMLTSTDTEDYVVEGVFSEVEADPTDSPEAISDKASRASETMFGEPKDDGVRRGDHSWPVNLVEATKKHMHPDDQTIANATAVLNLSPCNPKTDPKVIGSWVIHYLSARYDEGLDVKEAQAKADKTYEKGGDDKK